MTNRELAYLIIDRVIEDKSRLAQHIIEDVLNEHCPVSAAIQNTTAANTNKILIDIARVGAGFTNIENPNLNPGHNA